MTTDRSIEPVIRKEEGPAPLSYPQERMFLLDQLMPGLGAYNVPTLVAVERTLDEQLLRRAFERVVDRHEILRTRVRLIAGEPRQEPFRPRTSTSQLRTCGRFLTRRRGSAANS